MRAAAQAEGLGGLDWHPAHQPKQFDGFAPQLPPLQNGHDQARMCCIEKVE